MLNTLLGNCQLFQFQVWQDVASNIDRSISCTIFNILKCVSYFYILHVNGISCYAALHLFEGLTILTNSFLAFHNILISFVLANHYFSTILTIKYKQKYFYVLTQTFGKPLLIFHAFVKRVQPLQTQFIYFIYYNLCYRNDSTDNGENIHRERKPQ